jgi:UDP-N-acetylmuramate dehydrogenase
MKIDEQISLAPLTTFGIGGAARWFAEARSEPEVVEAVRWARERELALFVLGGGSNLLVADAGFPGLVIRVALRGVALEDSLDGTRLYRAAAGEEWDEFVQRTVMDNCGGVECLAGIPGTVGGTPVQNVGAYGQEVSKTIAGVRALDLLTMEFVELSRAECRFAYRVSLFNTFRKGRYVVTRVDYRLSQGAAPCLLYTDLQRAFAGEASATLADVAAKVREIRRAKGMLLVEGDADCRSAGSFFRNPYIGVEQFLALAAAYPGAEPPHYQGGIGFVKLPAAWLIEHAGFPKGYALGRVGISSKHTLALVNLGGATAAEVLLLRDRIVTAVQERFGIELKMEPVVVGEAATIL